jgi:hypothetical protein
MAQDYDAPRRTESDEVSEDSLEELKARRNEAQSSAVDVDETDTAESFELPGADLSGEELSVRVVPKQADLPGLRRLNRRDRSVRRGCRPRRPR